MVPYDVSTRADRGFEARNLAGKFKLEWRWSTSKQAELRVSRCGHGSLKCQNRNVLLPGPVPGGPGEPGPRPRSGLPAQVQNWPLAIQQATGQSARYGK